MNKAEHTSRLNFLLLKVKANLPLTESERAEYEHLKGIRIVETTGGGPLIVEPANKPDSNKWNEYAARRNAENIERARRWAEDQSK